ncbi:MAG: copper chaperone PCu(A)C [Hyphomicrobiales bacterium]
MKVFLRFALALVLSFSGVNAFAHHYSVGKLKITHPWARSTSTGAKNGAAFMSITNTGSQPDRLIGASSPVAKVVQIHTMSMENGVMKMRHLTDGLEIAPGQTVVLKPGSFHVMLMGLKKPLKKGDEVPVFLNFEKTAGIGVMVKVGAEPKGHN